MTSPSSDITSMSETALVLEDLLLILSVAALVAILAFFSLVVQSMTMKPLVKAYQ